MSTPSRLLLAYTYAALIAAEKDTAVTITALEQVLAGQYTTVNGNNGLVMTSANEAGKSFTFSFPSGLGPQDILNLSFESIGLLKSYSAEELERLMFARRSSIGRVQFV